MARSFTGKEAKELIAEHKQLQKKSRDAVRFHLDCTADVQNEIQRLIGIRAFSEWVEADLAARRPSEQADSVFRFLTAALVRYRGSRPLAESCKLLQSRYASDVDRNLKTVSAGTNQFKWLVTSSEKKERANQAYVFLSELLANSYAQTIHACDVDTNALRYQAELAAQMDFMENRREFRRELQTVSNAADPVASVRKLIAKNAENQDLRMQAAQRTETARTAVIDAAIRMIMAEVLHILETIPVEELNRESGSGFRVKTLRDYGFQTMADIYSASVHQLASAHGISETAASAMKLLASRLAEQSVSSAKIKISADNRTDESTALLQEIYVYRSLMRMQDALMAFHRPFEENLRLSESDLKAVEDGVNWLFLSTTEKQRVLESYAHLNSMCAGSYQTELRAKCAEIMAVATPDAETVWEDFQQNSIAVFSELEELVPGALGTDDSQYGLPEDLARAVQEECLFPDGLLCQLRRYQELGVKYILHQERVLLGDEMGLGKTVQAIAAMVSLKNTGASHFLVICPASVLTNWCREICSKSKLPVIKVHGGAKQAAFADWLKSGGVAVTTYEAADCFQFAPETKIDMVVVDEAHYIKNKSAKRSRNVSRICESAKRLLFMTGTALENNVDEMISLIRILQPQIASDIRSVAFMASAPQFREKIAPVYYRRKREDVLTELPELIEKEEWCKLLSDEEQIYEQTVLNRSYQQVRQVSWNAPDLANSAKAQRLLEIIEDAVAENRKVIVFSFFLHTIEAVCALLGERCMPIINGTVAPAKRQDIVDAFEAAPAGTVLPAQIVAGGTGLNIQAASVVILCEPQLKPSVENQAIARAYRMGQTRNVLVFRLLCENTVDEKIMEMLASKQAQFDAFADDSVAAEKAQEIDETAFKRIIEEEITRINAKNNNSAN